MYRVVSVTLAIAALFLKVTMAKDYTVGSPKGSWDAATNLKAWSKSRVLTVGDNLRFKYPTSHDVVEVSQSDYAACKASKPIFKDNSGLTVIRLTKPGKRYFICGTPTHCASGMKLEVNVLPATKFSSLSTSPVTSPALQIGSPVAAPSESPVSPPTVTSSAATFQPMIAAIISAALLAFAA